MTSLLNGFLVLQWKFSTFSAAFLIAHRVNTFAMALDESYAMNNGVDFGHFGDDAIINHSKMFLFPSALYLLAHPNAYQC